MDYRGVVRLERTQGTEGTEASLRQQEQDRILPGELTSPKAAGAVYTGAQESVAGHQPFKTQGCQDSSNEG